MIVPDVTKWTAGEEPDADMLNARASDMISFLLNPPMAMAHQETAQTVSSQTWTIVNIDTLDYDNDGIVDLDDNKFIIQTPGWYEISCGSGFHWGTSAATTSLGFRIAAVRLNGSGVPNSDRGKGGYRCRRDTIPDETSNRSCRTGGSMVAEFLNKGDWLELMTYQNSTESLDTYVAEADAYPFISVRWVSN